jgi:hypothetical protein
MATVRSTIGLLKQQPSAGIHNRPLSLESGVARSRRALMPLSEFELNEVAGELLVTAISGPPVRRFDVRKYSGPGDRVEG